MAASSGVAPMRASPGLSSSQVHLRRVTSRGTGEQNSRNNELGDASVDSSAGRLQPFAIFWQVSLQAGLMGSVRSTDQGWKRAAPTGHSRPPQSEEGRRRPA